MTKTQKLTLAAVFVAITIILKMFATVFLFGTTKFGFSFIPSILGAAMLGPFWGGLMGGVSDVLGYLVKQDGAFFPGFTISAILKGMIYGLFLFKKPKNILNIILAISASIVFVDLIINAFWINIFYGTPIIAVFISKITTLPVFLALQFTIMFILFKYLDKEISKIIE